MSYFKKYYMYYHRQNLIICRNAIFPPLGAWVIATKVTCGEDWLLKVLQTHIHTKDRGRVGLIVSDHYLFLEHIDETVKLGLFPQYAFQDVISVFKGNLKRVIVFKKSVIWVLKIIFVLQCFSSENLVRVEGC